MESLRIADLDYLYLRAEADNQTGTVAMSGVKQVSKVPQTDGVTAVESLNDKPEPEKLDIQIPQEDVIEHVCRSSGPGGQSVNKLNSAIKLEHLPTKITVSMQDEKSQHKNRAKAWRILRSKVYEFHRSKKQAERDSQRKAMIGSGDRSEKIRTYNYPQNRLTDHRINLSLYNLDKIMTGNMGQLIAALQDHNREQRLKNL